jgi:hypothetical protein
MTALDHYNILRAIYIDEHNYCMDFLTKLFIFLVKLRNYGLYDHGLLSNLSEYAVGSLYNGVEHSTIYEESKVYDLFNSWMFEGRSADLLEEMRVLDYPPGSSNSYHIPWSLRGLVNDGNIQGNSELFSELQDIIKEFKEWNPKNGLRKELRYKLDALSKI